jgi:hypothetical protein
MVELRYGVELKKFNIFWLVVSLNSSAFVRCSSVGTYIAARKK